MFSPDVHAAIRRAAARYDADAVLLQHAIADESAPELARVLRLDPAAAQTRMAQIQRVLAVNSDWGAGCALLTDDVAAELVAVIDAL
jgi:hypothetical protein